MVEALLLALVPWIIVAVLHSRETTYQKRGRPGPVRDQLTPEEVEAHHDKMRRKHSDEMRALRANGTNR